jgi:hypothetical protein
MIARKRYLAMVSPVHSSDHGLGRGSKAGAARLPAYSR